MPVYYLAEPDFKWPDVGDRVTMLPPSVAGTEGDCRRPDGEKSPVIEPKPEFGRQHTVLDIVDAQLPRRGRVGKLTLTDG